MGSPEYVRDLDLIAESESGQLVAFCQCYFDEREWEANERKEGWTDPLGTAAHFRRKGLARAVLLEALRRLRNLGLDDAILSVGSGNTSARDLYESLGYRPAYRVQSWSLTIG